MSSHESLSDPAPGALWCGVGAHAAVRATPEEVTALRQKPLRVRGKAPPATLFKHVDEQTMVGLAAVTRAIDEHGLGTTSFDDWGVIAAPRFLGRLHFANALQRFHAEGAWGISPHLIPHRSLHSLSGMVSQILRIHGPNFGVGGGPGSASEAVLTAAALLAGGRLPGAWLVISGNVPEPVPPRADAPPPVPPTSHISQAVALALLPARPEWEGPRLEVKLPAVWSTSPRRTASEGRPLFEVECLMEAFGEGAPGRRGVWRLVTGGAVEFCPICAATEEKL